MVEPSLLAYWSLAALCTISFSCGVLAAACTIIHPQKKLKKDEILQEGK